MHVLLTVVSLSLSGSVMFLLYLAARRFLKQYLPASAFYALMLVILLRLLIPYSPAFSVMNRLSGNLAAETGGSFLAEEAPETQQFVGETGPSAANEAAETFQPAAQPAEVMSNPPAEQITDDDAPSAMETDHRPRAIPWAAILPAVWLIVALGKLGFNITAYAVFRRHVLWDAVYSQIHTRILHDIAQGRRYPDVYLSPCADTPMVLGLLNPVIVLPREDYTIHEAEHILRHELCHYRRFDVGVKWLGVLAGALHWFNPLMMLFRRELEDVCECSCDAAATRGMDSSERKAYIRTLLRTVDRQTCAKVVPLTAMSGSAKRLDERFRAVSQPKHVTPARAALSVTAVVCAAAVGLGLGACTSLNVGETAQDNTVTDSDNSFLSDETDVISGSYLFPSNDKNVDSYPFYQYGYETMSFEIPNPEAVYDEKRQVWTVPHENGYYENSPPLTGSTSNRVFMRAVMNLLNYENYERVNEIQSWASENDAMYITFYNELHFYLNTNAQMLVWLDFSDIHEYPHSREYPDWLEQNDRYAVFQVPDELYGKVRSLLYPIAKECQENSRTDRLTLYHEDDIGNDFVYAVLCGKLLILSDDYGCDFFADVGSPAYDEVWELCSGIGQCTQIQARPELAKTDGHIMIIGPENYGAEYVGEHITIYADSGVICARFKGDEMWYSVPKDLGKQCREIAALQF